MVKSLTTIHFWVLIGAIVAVASCQTVAPKSLADVMAHQHSENYKYQEGRLDIAVLKGFSGPIYYIGSGRGFDFFTIRDYRGYFRLEQGRVKLPNVFVVGKGKPYKVDYETMSKMWSHYRIRV